MRTARERIPETDARNGVACVRSILREPRAESREPRAESREPRAESGGLPTKW